jgi:hypothetical protein
MQRKNSVQLPGKACEARAKANAERATTKLAWKGDRDRLKKQFLEHCKGHREEYNARLKCHKDRVAARGVSAGNDSETYSEDSRSSLMNELDETEAELAKAKKELKD